MSFSFAFGRFILSFIIFIIVLIYQIIRVSWRGVSFAVKLSRMFIRPVWKYICLNKAYGTRITDLSIKGSKSLEKGKVEKALASFQEALDVCQKLNWLYGQYLKLPIEHNIVHIRDIIAHESSGRESLGKVEFKKAEREFSRCLEIVSRLYLEDKQRLEEKFRREICTCQVLALHEEGNGASKKENNKEAIARYTEALEKAYDTELRLEILISRSESYSKLSDHQLALDDATRAYQMDLYTCYKGYVRAAYVMKDLKKPEEAVEVLCNGLKETNLPPDFKVDFIVEIALFLNKFEGRCEKMRCHEIDPKIWRGVFKKMADQAQWSDIKQLLSDKSIIITASDCGKDIAIQDLLRYCQSLGKDDKLWGQDLAIALMKRGSQYPRGESVAFMKTALDFGIATENFQLLEYIFNRHVRVVLARNEKDMKGETLYQYLLKSYHTDEGPGLDALRMLGRYGVSARVAPKHVASKNVIDAHSSPTKGSLACKQALEKKRKERIKANIQKFLDDIEQVVSDSSSSDEPDDDSDSSDTSARIDFKDATLGGQCEGEEPLSEPSEAKSLSKKVADDRRHNTPLTEGDVCHSDDKGNDIEEFDFKGLEWEIQCTPKVWNILKTKPRDMRMRHRILKKIKMIGSGDFGNQPHLQKQLKITDSSSVSSTIELYEAKITKSDRLIWEIGIDLSCRCNNSSSAKPIYSQVIWLWDIVPHNRIYKSVHNVVESHRRGEKCLLKKRLQEVDAWRGQNKHGKEPPSTYSEVGEDERGSKVLTPVTSSTGAEYNIMKWYSFDIVAGAIQRENGGEKIDFPFKTTELENTIINLKQDPPCPLILLGRSGTGKTTCLLYRLWSKFNEGLKTLVSNTVMNASDTDSSGQYTQVIGATSTADNDRRTTQTDNLDDSEPNARINEVTCTNKHQLFVTKNPVLCTQIKNNFRNLSHGCPEAQPYVQVENEPLPNRLQQVHPCAYPLFLTSQQFLVILDASLPAPYFFPRNDDGSLKQSRRTDREVTYDTFAYELWPLMIKKQKERVTCHPSLVWTEINSFIKGSIEAVHSVNGCLDEDVYKEIGKKRAPNFPGRRGQVYELFQTYTSLIKQSGWVDETDLIFNLYSRMSSLSFPEWFLHEIYVDETQDFTQAELALLIRSCLNPNDMFLTGDTAQAIMRGISFRFEDLKSLFYYAGQSHSARRNLRPVGVPRTIHKLIYNYRSHTGILNLATSLLDLIGRFFPASCDRNGIESDRGLFDGPKPVLIKCNSYNDLAGLLRGNTRKTSPIEFGAHQAIIVANDMAKENLPKELRSGLVLTIYKSKGLEFDDVLLYNFFKDSQAKEEWRVALEHIDEIIREQDEIVSKDDAKELIEIDIEAYVSKGKNRPRPLTFDPEKHKILNSELKHLYTAVTRVRANVWIFDEDETAREAMFTYFQTRKLVTVVEAEGVVDGQRLKELFPKKSSKRVWKRKGDGYLEKGEYELAADCYRKAGRYRAVARCLANKLEVDARRKADKEERCNELLAVALDHLNCHQYEQAANCLHDAEESRMEAQLRGSRKLKS